MRRMLLVLTVTALVAAMMVSAGPAKADVSISSGGGGSSFGGANSSNFSSGGSFTQVGGVVDDIDFGGIEFVADGIDLDID